MSLAQLQSCLLSISPRRHDYTSLLQCSETDNKKQIFSKPFRNTFSSESTVVLSNIILSYVKIICDQEVFNAILNQQSYRLGIVYN